MYVERDESRVSVTVTDDGAGIPATMRKVFPGLDDEGAAARALEAGGTASGDRRRGFGLHSAADLSSRGFVVYIESRGAAVWIKKEKTVFCHKSGGSVQGTRIQITCPTGVPSA